VLRAVTNDPHHRVINRVPHAGNQENNGCRRGWNPDNVSIEEQQEIVVQHPQAIARQAGVSIAEKDALGEFSVALCVRIDVSD
jgi:hypothetical protein